MGVTAETITDEDIRALMDDDSAPGLIRGAARGALRSPDLAYRARARARCVTFLNTRGSK